MTTSTTTTPLEPLVRALSRLPGIGEKSATRLAIFLLRDTKGVAADLSRSLKFVIDNVRFCSECQNISETQVCGLCEDTGRERHTLCIVQEPVDLMMVERIGDYRGLYHVLHGSISPLDGMGPEDLRLKNLMSRIQKGSIQEVILATNPNADGETTAQYLKRFLSPLSIRVSRIASGIPVGGSLEYSDPKTLSRSLSQRREY